MVSGEAIETKPTNKEKERIISSILDDFFGDSATAIKECLYCGGNEGELIVAINDAYGPTHWCHEECRRQNAESSGSGSATLPDFDRDTSTDGVE